MKQITSWRISVWLTLAAAVVIIGCGGGATGPATSSAGPSGAASQPASPEQARADFEAQQRRIEAERQRQEELKQHRRSFVAVDFKEIDADGRVIVTITNGSDKDIDDIRGGFHVEDTEGNTITSTGFTEGVPGSVFLAAGATRSHTPFISRREELIQRLRTSPGDVRFSFEAQEITYADGSSQADLEG